MTHDHASPKFAENIHTLTRAFESLGFIVTCVHEPIPNRLLPPQDPNVAYYAMDGAVVLDGQTLEEAWRLAATKVFDDFSLTEAYNFTFTVNPPARGDCWALEVSVATGDFPVLHSNVPVHKKAV